MGLVKSVFDKHDQAEGVAINCKGMLVTKQFSIVYYMCLISQLKNKVKDLHLLIDSADADLNPNLINSSKI